MIGDAILDYRLVEQVALVMKLFDEFAELIGEAVYGLFDIDQQVECHDDGEADTGDCDEEILFHGITLLVR